MKDDKDDFNEPYIKFNRQFWMIVLGVVAFLLLLSTINNFMIQQDQAEKIPQTQDVPRTQQKNIVDRSLVFYNKKTDKGAALMVESNNVLEATVKISSTLKNCKANVASPAILDIQLSPDIPIELINYTPVNENEKWTLNYDFQWEKGLRGGAPDLEYVYELPYKENQSFQISQGAHGRKSHYHEYDEFAIDFNMPIGTTVYSTREGQVIAIKMDSTTQGNTRRFARAANYIVIKHADGGYGLYYHLKPESALVKLGSHVATGQPIAQSGNTGWTSGPHLHFAVVKVVSQNGDIRHHSVPIKFNTAQGIVENLEKGKTYNVPSPAVPAQ